MNRPALYDDDILEWSEQQAAALRRVARLRPDVSNEIDWENVAEEIEDVGRSQFLAVESLTRRILIHIIKGVSVRTAAPLQHWRREVLAFHTDLRKRMTPSMRSRLDLAETWRDALPLADADLGLHGEAILPTLRGPCPLTIDQIVDPDFDFIATVETLRRRCGAPPFA